jgi:hypothetical protein
MQPEMKYPGVFIGEVLYVTHCIESVVTPAALYVGWAPQGPVDQATLVRSWRDFQRQSLGSGPPGHSGNAVHQFFSNGGQQVHISRTYRAPTFPIEAALAAYAKENPSYQ